MKYYTITLSLFIFLLLALVPYSQNIGVKAVTVGYVYTEDFEDEALYDQAIEGSWFYSEHDGVGAFYCMGDGTFRNGEAGAGEGWWNFTYDLDYTVGNLSFYYATSFTAGSGTYTYDFYDFSNDDNIFRLRNVVSGSQDIFSFWNYSSSSYDIVSTTSIQTNYMNFTFYYDNLTIYFRLITGGGVLLKSLWLNSTNAFINPIFSDNSRMTHIHCTNGDANSYMSFGELSIMFVESIYVTFDTSGLVQVGDLDLGDISPMASESGGTAYIEIERNVPISCEIIHVAIKVRIDWRTLFGGELDDLVLHINDNNVGSPTGYYQSDINFDIFYWENVDIILDEERPLFEFRSTNTNYHWRIPTVTEDIDNDGDAEYIHHFISSKWQGIYDNIYSPIGEIIIHNSDIVYSFWYQELVPPYENEYNYWIDCIPDSVNQYDPISCLYTCPIDVNVNLRIFNPFDDIVYNRSVEYTGLQTGLKIFTPTVGGFAGYNFTLYSVANDTTMAYKTVSVSNISYNYLLFTDPNPSKIGTKFDLYYIYNSSTFGGRITITRIQDGIIYFDEEIENNTPSLTKIADISLPLEGIYECRLYRSTGTSDFLKYYYQHICQVEHTNTVYMGRNVYSLPFQNPDNQWIFYSDYEVFDLDFANNLYFVGYHNFMLQDVYLQILSDKISVGGYYSFAELIPQHILDIADGGEYTVYLKLDVNGTVITLASYSFALAESGITGDEERILPLVDPMTGAILGGLLTVGFLFIPLYIVAGMSKTKFKVDIPPYVYAITGGTGAIVSTLFGFWGWEVPFFILALGIIGITIMWLAGKRGE